MLIWEDGPREKGCTYHTLAKLRDKFGSGHLDVFVVQAV